MTSEEKKTKRVEADLQAKIDERMSGAHAQMDADVRRFAESIEQCFQAAEASITRLEAEFDEMFRALPVTSSGGWVN